jgi:hypothetical protein
MWPGLLEGDWILYGPLPGGKLGDLVGQVAVAHSSEGLVAHRIVRIFGSPGSEWLVLAGDLACSPDRPRPRRDVVGLARAVHRPGQGFIDLPKGQAAGALAGSLLQGAARFFKWAERAADAGTA